MRGTRARVGATGELDQEVAGQVRPLPVRIGNVGEGDAGEARARRDEEGFLGLIQREGFLLGAERSHPARLLSPPGDSPGPALKNGVEGGMLPRQIEFS